ncbi:MAG: hypothetical protein ABSG78_07165 [Verrucomicrobiota bacterium]|jgi:hypothetical protein
MPEDEMETGVKRKGQWLVLLVLLGGALAVLCHDGFKPYHVMWANDTALGAIKATSARLPDTYTGHWIDGNWIGIKDPASSPTVDGILLTFIPVEWFYKTFAPLSMLLLGFSAWVMFRQLKFAPMVCVVGGLAAGLNMHCWSNATWGLGTWNIAIAMIFLAVAALVTDSIRQTWIKAALAGLAVGMSVMEGFDSGALLSVYAGVFVVFLCWITESGLKRRICRSAGMGVVVVLFAVWIAFSTLSTLVGTSIKGISGMGQTAAEKQRRWTEATMWSLPKLETLRIIIPGLFGYRLANYDTTPDKAGVYWGKVAEDPRITALNSSDPQVRANMAKALSLPPEAGGVGLPPEEVKVLEENDAQAREVIVDNVAQRNGWQRRHTGSGEFAGVLVSVLALFALASTWRRASPPFTKKERRLVWFWGLAAMFSLVAAWGRYSFLYALLYKIPYFSTIRNPIKFLHAFNLTWIILAGYGLEALYRGYLRSPVAAPEAPAQPESRRFTAFEKGWMGGLILAAGAAGLFFWIYGAGNGGPSRHLFERLSQYIGHQEFGEAWGSRIAAFAIGEAGRFVLYLGLSAGAVVCILTGVLRGPRAVWAWVALSAVMICDLSRADRPWVRYYNSQEKYADNDIMKILRQEPYEHRVAAKLAPNESGYALCHGEYGVLGAVCHWWLENDFPYHDIEAIDFDQLSRPPVQEINILSTFAPKYARSAEQVDFAPPVRLWKLCNARYLLAPADVVPYLNERADPMQRGFQIRARFDLVYKPWVTNKAEDSGDLTAVITNNGPFALIEITNALPRAKLYSNWQIPADDASTLRLLDSETFDPMKTVLVSSNTPVPAAAAPEADPGTVRIVDYKPKEVHLRATAKSAAVLLLNDRTDPDWRAWVDQKPVAPLQCNYIMRGVYLTPGEHTVDFRFEPSQGPLYVTLAALAFGIVLGAWLIYMHLVALPKMAAAAPPPKAPAKPKRQS